MRVPDLSSSKNANEAPDEAKETSLPITTEPNDTAKAHKRQRRCKERCKTFRGPFEVVSGPHRPSRSPRAKAQALGTRQKSCPQGKAFYKCANGFTGCCSVDPCDPRRSCPDGGETSSPQSTQTTSSNAPGPSSPAGGSSRTGRSRGKPASTPKSSSGMQTSSASSVTSASRSEPESGPVKSAPACPGANNTIFHDASHIMYRIHCGMDNTYSTSKEVSVSSGGYGDCFSSCSTSASCNGFTFVGEGSGHCYLKDQMPKEQLVDKDSSEYVSCTKVHPGISVPSPSSSPEPSSSKKSSLGAIIGGALAGAFLLILLILLAAWLIKRHKKKTEQRRSTIITHISHGPIEPQPLEVGGHQRQVSTSHDVFQPFGGSIYGAGGNDSNHAGQPSRSTPPGIRAEGGPFIIPATSFNRPYEDEIPMLYRASVDRSQSPAPRSFRFREHLSDLDDSTFPSPWSKRQFATSPLADSPTLGRRKEPPPPLSLATHVTNGRRVFSRNPYEPYRTAGRNQSTEEISPSSILGPSDGKFDVSPLDVNRARGR